MTTNHCRLLGVSACIAGHLLLSACGATLSPQGATDQEESKTCSPSQIVVDVTASERVNPSEFGDALPVEVRFYVLASGERFGALSYEELRAADEEGLGDDLLARRAVTMFPGARERVVLSAEGADGLGVVAFFRQPGMPSTWRPVLSLPSPSLSGACPPRELQLSLWLHGTTVARGEARQGETDSGSPSDLERQ